MRSVPDQDGEVVSVGIYMSRDAIMALVDDASNKGAMIGLLSGIAIALAVVMLVPQVKQLRLFS